MTGERKYQEIELSKLKANPWNPRKSFEGQKFNDLVASIRAKGVLEPILVRPVKKDFEIIAGERRFRASCEIAQANGGLKKATIPTIVQEMTDDDAFDVMTIENLHRDDLSELEEAQSFKQWVDRRKGKDKGSDAVAQLAERTGIGPHYIRRRIHIMMLPDNVLKAWEKGKIQFGHCEQLVRLGDKKKIDEYFKKLINWHEYPVRRLRDDIDREAIELQHAMFDKEKAGCTTCGQNSDTQKALFGDDMALAATACLDPKCFKTNQNGALVALWPKKLQKKYGTSGWRFYEGYGQPRHEIFRTRQDRHGKDPGEKCAECKDYVTLLKITGKPEDEKACIGKESCYNAIRNKPKKAEKQQEAPESGIEAASGSGPEAPRVTWHGTHFREEFFKEVLPSWISNLDVDSDQCLRIVLAGILNSNFAALEHFRKMALTSAVPYRSGRYSFKPADWKYIESMDFVALRTAMKALGGYVALQTDKTSHETRCAIAAHLGIDLARDWRITASYLEKKTKAEILAFGEQLGIFADPRAEAFLKDTLGKRKFSALKKSELDRVILESGVDLSGKVPAEILAVKDDRRGFDEDEDVCIDYVSCFHFDECELIGQKCKREWDDDDKPPCCHECDHLEACQERCQLYVDLEGNQVTVRTCRECGCTEEDACEEGCTWVEDDLCSACKTE